MKNENLERFYIGEVGVDSGQLMVCDPCYISNEWDRDVEPNFYFDRKYINKDGKVLEYEKDFPHYEASIESENGKTMNELLASGEYTQIEVGEDIRNKGSFSYAGCCQATLSKNHFGQLNYKLGHAGSGVVFSSGYGDGCYPVYGYKNKEGRIVKIEVIME